MEQTFEDKMNALNDIVAKLESGKLTLDENLKAYEDGMKLYRDLSAILKKKEGVVRKIIEETGEEVSFVPEKTNDQHGTL